ncbi:hypothetical protein BRAS3843_3260025 [Bradyrhizobium sp. STM 3843]|nr:hypothetical protein BRAS3843_3260025 [Bradyrhizobium sp. STM 3843]
MRREPKPEAYRLYTNMQVPRFALQRVHDFSSLCEAN